MSAPAIIHDLVNRFRDSRELYRSGRYNEAQLRQEFLNPLFEALGWDMYNRSNFAPQYREVIHEDSLADDDGSTKAPDYAFRIGTTRKFFVEAKKPKVNIRYEIDPAYQLRRYAWNAHLPLSILTDFEELAVYDCRTRPDPKDSAATGRVMLFTYEDYLTRWDELAQIFSKDAVWNGSFDRYAEGTKGKRGTTEVDAEFLKEIEQWRLLLARNIALRNFRSSGSAPIVPEKKVTDSFATPSPKDNIATPSSDHNIATPSPEDDIATPSPEGGRGVREVSTGVNLHRAERQLNYAVQTTIDRILFLRICEDRQIEPTDQLLQIAEGSDIYAHLLILFQKADQKYNSGLFHFNKEKTQTSEPDTFTPTLQIDDKVLRQVIKSTYYPCPYMFNEIPVEILGQVYEQFLGSVIRLTPGGQAKVEEKPEVRKAGGVYYTPRYIVDYIVQNTIGRLLGVSKPVGETCHGLPANEVQPSFQDPHPPSAGLRPSPPIPLLGSSTIRPKEGLEGVGSNRSLSGVTSTNINSQQSGLTSLTPSSVAVGGGSGGGSFNQLQQEPSITPVQALSLRVVDPACGSGSFLLGAYQYLLDWHLNYYLSHDPESHTRGKNPPLVATEGGEYRLTTQTKKQILTSSIYGVDIDSQAVEVTKLSLLLKLLEGETGQLTLGFERVLPDLGQNIRCGNSLIGWDYFGGQIFPDEEEIQRVNPFDWQRAFPQVFTSGGFDAVIGNPPYVRADALGDDFKNYIEHYYLTYTSNADMYSYFIEKSLSILRGDGFFGMITSNKFIKTAYGKNLRNHINDFTEIVRIIDFGELPVFNQAATFPAIIILINNKVKSQFFNYYPVKSLLFQSLDEALESIPVRISSSSMTRETWILSDATVTDLISRLKSDNLLLAEFLPNKINYGIKTALDEAFVVDREQALAMINETPRAIEHVKPYLKGTDIRNYRITNEGQKYLLFFGKGWTRKRYGSNQERDLFMKVGQEFPAIMSHLEKYRSKAQRRSDKGDYWWELRGCDYIDGFEKPKIVWPEIAKESRFAFDDNSNYLNKTCFFTNTNDYYLLGVLNSKLIWFYLKNVCSVLGDPDKGGRLMQQKIYIEKIPIVRPNEQNMKTVSEIGELAFSLTQLLKTSNEYHDVTGIKSRYINVIRDSIDQKVNLLYRLTDEEIRIVKIS